MTARDLEPISDSLIRGVITALASNRPVRQRLPGGGMLNMDRLLPFLCIYRRNPRRVDAGTGAVRDGRGGLPECPGRGRATPRAAETGVSNRRNGGHAVWDHS